MIELILFDDETYGLRNTFTGQILGDKRGNPLSFKSQKRAIRRGNRIVKKLNKAVARLEKNK